MKKQITEQRKIFANFISDKASYPKYVKNSYHSIAKNNPKTKQQQQWNLKVCRGTE